MSWNLLNDVLKSVAKYETAVGKVWLSVLLIFRLLVLVAVADKVYSDEQKEFECNTRQPGCKTVCYDTFFPVSHIRFWAIQLVLVATPTLLVLMHVAARRIRRKFKGREDLEKMAGGLVWTYQLSVLCRIAVEVTAAYLFWRFCSPLGIVLPMVAQCSVAPCPNSVDCFISRPSEKTVFIIFMLSVSGICLCLNLIELFYIPIKYWLGPALLGTRSNTAVLRSTLLSMRGESGLYASASEGEDAPCCACRCQCDCHKAASPAGGGCGGGGGGGCATRPAAVKANGSLPGRCVVPIDAPGRPARKKGLGRSLAVEVGDGDGGGGGGGGSVGGGSRGGSRRGSRQPAVSSAGLPSPRPVSPRAPCLATHGKCRSCGEEATEPVRVEEEVEDEEEVEEEEGDKAVVGTCNGGCGKARAAGKERRAGSVGEGK